MPSDFLTPFPELDEEFCQSLRALEATESLVQRTPRPPEEGPCWGPRPPEEGPCWGPRPPEEGPCWGPVGRLLPRPALQRLPLLDRSVSLTEGKMAAVLPLLPAPPPSSARYKTELCRTFAESGGCKYGAKCQFAHGAAELRGLSRHPRYKTERCRTFHSAGLCPYGARCHFLHNAGEEEGGRPPPLRHSLSFAGFSSSSSPSPPPPCSAGSPELLSPPLLARLLPPCPFYSSSSSSSDSLGTSSPFSPPSRHLLLPPAPQPSLPAPPGLWRCSSADSLSEEGYTSSCSLSSGGGGESPAPEVGQRLPIFSRLSVTDR